MFPFLITHLRISHIIYLVSINIYVCNNMSHPFSENVFSWTGYPFHEMYHWGENEYGFGTYNMDNNSYPFHEMEIRITYFMQ